jgi:hypothetical protein
VLRDATIIRRALTHPIPLGLERALDALAGESSTRADWISDAVAAVESAPVRTSDVVVIRPPRCRALIVLGNG